MEIPKRIKILGKTYKVISTDKVYHDTEGDVYGMTDGMACALHVATRAHTQQQKDTLIHEAVHAIDQNMHLNLEEYQVHGLGCAIYQMLTENPKFVEWIMSRQ